MGIVFTGELYGCRRPLCEHVVVRFLNSRVGEILFETEEDRMARYCSVVIRFVFHAALLIVAGPYLRGEGYRISPPPEMLTSKILNTISAYL